jgi:hypothetical protein
MPVEIVTVNISGKRSPVDQKLLGHTASDDTPVGQRNRLEDRRQNCRHDVCRHTMQCINSRATGPSVVIIGDLPERQLDNRDLGSVMLRGKPRCSCAAAASANSHQVIVVGVAVLHLLPGFLVCVRPVSMARRVCELEAPYCTPNSLFVKMPYILRHYQSDRVTSGHMPRHGPSPPSCNTECCTKS